MAFIKRQWTEKEAEDWTKEDLIACIISPLSYMFLMIGAATSLLLLPSGFIILAAGIILMLIMIYVIDPKLKTISTEYEKKQKQYLTNLDKTNRWEEQNG